MKDDYYKVVGSFFKSKREHKGVSINDTASAMDHAKSWYYDIEIGRNRICLKECFEICKYLDTSMNELQEYLNKHYYNKK